MPTLKTVEILVFSFDELSESAKEKAREWWRNNPYDEWWDGVYETASTAGKLLGIEIGAKSRYSSLPSIWFSGFYSQSDFCYIEAKYSYAKGSVKAIKAEFPQDEELHKIAKGLFDIQKRNFYRLCASMSGTHRNNQAIEVWHSLDNYRDLCEDEELLKDILRDFTSWIYSRLTEEYEYLNSDAYVDENICINEYQFTEDGEIF